MSILDKLIRWNVWSGAVLNKGQIRDITSNILDTIEAEEVVVLSGPRRTGKSTILYQIMDVLISRGIDPKAILHVNFEEPALAQELNLQLLDTIYNEYRSKIYPQGKTYVFLDEIQHIKEWERWVRARNETEDIKIFITGSSAQLMSREFGTVLTGRHLSFKVLPLNFAEFLRFNSIELKNQFFGNNAPPIIANALERYIVWGGYPRLALEKNDALKQQILTEYFDDMIFKDVALRHQVRELNLLRNLAIYCLTQTACFFTSHRLAGQFLSTTEAMRTYVSHLHEAFLFEILSCFSLKIAERNRNPFKLHMVDIGLRNILAVSNSDDIGRNIETLVHNKINNDRNSKIFYYKEQNVDVDLLVHQNNKVTELIQVMHGGLNASKTFNREINSLHRSMQVYPFADAKLIVNEFPTNWQPDKELLKSKIQIIPLWKYLLDLE